MSIRVHELAKELKLSSKELIEKLKSLGIDAKSHMSVLAEQDVKKIKTTGEKKVAEKKTAEPVKSAEPAKPVTPVKAPAATATPVAPATPAPSAPVSGNRQTSSIESVKQELLLQRNAVKTAHVTPEIRKPRIPDAPAVTQSPAFRKPVVAQTPFKPKTPYIDPKKNIRPSFVPSAPTHAPEPKPAKKIQIAATVVVKSLSEQLSLNPSDIIARLIKLGIFANINQTIKFEAAAKLATELGFEVEKLKEIEEVSQTAENVIVKDQSKMVMRAPIVTFMGHVDHGKTSLLDAIRQTKVAAGEAGGITQHIGAYEVFLPKGAVTFLDTPGHEAFTAMRARGAKATDVVVLVVAADDGVMPQTVEAIDHAKAANVPIIVAINKMDLPSANPDRVKKGLMEHGLMTEDWGGKTVMVGVSAKTGKGIDDLLEMLILESELLELKADPQAAATGVVVEAQLSKETGVLATVLVQDGTLRIGDFAVVGGTYCKVRAMINDRGVRVKEAPPSMPVEILGLERVPKAGDRFYVVKDEKKAKEIVDQMEDKRRAEGGRFAGHMSLEHLSEEVKSGKVSELKLIIKSDVQGSVEALRATLGKIQAKNVRINIIHSGTGDVSESDAMLAAASDAVVIGFHVGIATAAKDFAEREQVDVRFYEIIYEVKTAIEKAMEGLLEPELKEMFVGVAEVRQVFKVSKAAGAIAGCSVSKGKIVRNFQCRVTRAGAKVHEGKVISLKRFKDDAREVLEGFECGIGVSNFDDILPGDRIEVFEIQKKERKLE